MTLKEVNEEISRLQRIQHELEKEEQEKNKELSRKFVGKCYKTEDGTIFKIISIPQTICTMHYDMYNQYQFPAVFLQFPDKPKERNYVDGDLSEFSPLCCKTVYFNINLGVPGHSNLRGFENCKEISLEEFETEFNKCIEYCKEQISV